MKRFNHISLLAALAVGLTAGGCADDTFDPVSGFDTDREVSLNLRLPAFATPGTRAVDENALQDVKIYFLQDQTVNGEETLSPESGNLKNGTSGYTATLLIPAGTTSIRLVGNYEACGLDLEAKGNVMTFNPNTKSALVFYGESSVQNLESGKGEIDMYRSCAKSTFAVADDVKDFTITGFHFYGNPDKGMVAYTSTDKQTLPPDVEYATEAVTPDDVSASSPFYHYEAEAGKCCWIIEGEYNGVKGYYKVAYIEQADAEITPDNNAPELDIIRNHHYQFTITGVSSPGYASVAEALKALPENRLKVMMKDHAENIFNIIACADYYLGVKETAQSRAEDYQGSFEIISNYKGGMPTAELAKSVGWLDNITVTPSGNATDDHTDGSLYTVKYDLVENSASSEPREAVIVVRVGDLSREVRVIQDGNDFLYGDLAPKVAIVNLEATAPTFSGLDPAIIDLEGKINYFSFLADYLKGETEAEMGVDRGNGLHFSVYADSGKQFKYMISKFGDTAGTATLTAANPEYIKVTDNTTYWTVELTDAGNKNYEIWQSSLTMNAGDTEITYQVYHAGVFHKLDGTCQTADPTGSDTTGWFYYEQTDVRGDDGQVYHILDRNIGASSNVAYSPSSAFLSDAVEARGAYMYVPQSNGISSMEKLLPAGFNTLPGMYHLSNMGVKLFNASQGSIGFDTQNSLLPRIYLPVSGAMDGSTHIDTFHCEIWSNTMIKGNQGFFEGDPEYGYWYRTLDIYGSEINISTSRIKSRATGANRGIPVRAMACPPAEPGWELPTIATGRSRAILINDEGWDDAKYNATLPDNSKISGDMIAGDSGKTWFYADIKGIPTNIRFAARSSGTEDFTWPAGSDIGTFSNQGAAAPKKATFRIYWQYDSNSRRGLNFWGSAGTYNNVYSSYPNTQTGVGDNGKFEKFNDSYVYLEFSYYDPPAGTFSYQFRTSNDGYGDENKDNQFNLFTKDEDDIYSYTIGQGSGKPSGEVVPPTQSDNITIYLYNEANWSSVYLYYWSTSANNSYPGTQMSIASEKGANWYKLEVPKDDAQNIQFNIGSDNTKADMPNFQSQRPSGMTEWLFTNKGNVAAYYTDGGSGGGDDSSLPEIPSGKARVVVYNESWWTGGVMEFEYQYNGNQQTKDIMTQVSVKGTTFFYLDIEPGMTQFHIQREKPDWKWTSNWLTTSGITAGNTYYYTVSSSGYLSSSSKKYAPRRAAKR